RQEERGQDDLAVRHLDGGPVRHGPQVDADPGGLPEGGRAPFVGEPRDDHRNGDRDPGGQCREQAREATEQERPQPAHECRGVGGTGVGAVQDCHGTPIVTRGCSARVEDSPGAIEITGWRNGPPTACTCGQGPDLGAQESQAESSRMTWRISSAVSEGVLPTWTPAASSASFLAAAVPDEPETIAPA